jgi:hypothetical protein
VKERLEDELERLKGVVEQGTGAPR